MTDDTEQAVNICSTHDKDRRRTECLLTNQSVKFIASILDQGVKGIPVLTFK